MPDIRLFICLVVSAVPVAATSGCGSEQEDGKGTPSEEDRVRQVLLNAERDYVTMDGEGFCARLIAKEQREVAAFARSMGKDRTCPQEIASSARRAVESGIEEGSTPPESIHVRIEGNRATVRVAGGVSAAEPGELVKVDGEWKVAEAGFEADPLARYAKP